MVLDRAEERVRDVGGKGGAVAPRHLCQLVVVGDVGGPVHYVARGVDHGSAGVGVYAFPEAACCSYREAGFLLGLSDCGLGAGFAGLDLAGGELPGELAFPLPVAGSGGLARL